MWCRERAKLIAVLALLAVGMPILVEGARILAIFPSPARSHQIVYRAYMKGLIDRGHQLTVMTTDPFMTDHPNVTIINWSFAYKIVNDNIDVVDMKQRNMNFFQIAQELRKVTRLFLEAQMSHPDVQALIHSRDAYFDAVIVEYYQFTPLYAFAELFNAPLIGVTSIDAMGMVHEVLGNVMNVVAHPEMNHKFTKNLNFLQRLEAVICNLMINYYIMPSDFRNYDRVIEQNFGSNMTRSWGLMNRIDFLMVNAEPALGYLRPTLPNTVQLGFLHIEPVKALPMDLQSYLDDSEHGVVYFSLGTLIRSDSLNQRNLNLFLEVFKSLKYDVLWKHDGEMDLNGTTNIRMVRWVPQQDVLAHPKVKAFVMQGGQQSMEEAIDRHVPLVVIPFNFDQFGNADKVLDLGIGRSVWMENLTVEKLRECIIEVTGNKRYKRNIARLGRLVRDQPMRPVEKAVWWTEYVIRHNGAGHYRYQPAKMSFIHYHYYDVAAAALVLLLVILAVLVYLLQWVGNSMARHLVSYATASGLSTQLETKKSL